MLAQDRRRIRRGIGLAADRSRHPGKTRGSLPAVIPHRRLGLALAALALVASSCSAILVSPPAPTPADFPGIVSALGARGITVSDVVSGDAGCLDTGLARTAIGFSASGLGLAAPTRLRVFIFNDQAAYERRRADVDTCAMAWATDPATFESIEAVPFVLQGQGPWPAEFKTALRAALTAAAGG